MKFKTIREGEQAVVLNHLGQGTLYVGPKRVFLFRERLQKLDAYTASQYEYLVVRDRTGLVEHTPGPCSMFCNPLVHEDIHVEHAIKIDASHMIVVYKKGKDNQVARRVAQGPTLFVPAADEWLHEFQWHGADPSNVTRMIPGSRRFTKLAAIPDQFYYNVKDVRTTDDTMLTVKLMIFYQLKDIITMLEATHDPIADMINAVCADVISFAGKLTYALFLENTHRLGGLESFPELTNRAKRVGYEVTKVVYRGYHASDQLQLMSNYKSSSAPHALVIFTKAMQDSAIHSRTQLRLDAELEKQRQRLTDFKLNKEQARSKMKQEMEHNRVFHRQTIEKMKQEHDLDMKQMTHTAQLDCNDIETSARLKCDASEYDHQVGNLKRLGHMNIDLTRYLVNKQPPCIDQEFRVVSSVNQSSMV